MTLLRRAAVKISSGVVQWASPGAKEWAQATAREVEFIEGDWTALGWALGSVRILWQRSEVVVLSPADVPQAASEFTSQIRRRTVFGCASCASVAIYFSWFGWHPMFGRHSTHHLMGRIGAYLTIVATLYMIGQLLVRRGRLSLRGGPPATAGEYRVELERQRDFHRGFWLWSRVLAMPPGYLLFCMSLPAANAVGAMLKFSIILSFLILCVIAVPLNLRLSHKYQRRIDELDVVERTA